MSNPETTSTRTVRPTIQTATIYLDGTTAPGSWFLAPATNPTDEYAAGYDGNEFASEAEALAGIPQLRQCGEEFAAVRPSRRGGALVISAPAIVAIVWGNAPRLTRDIYDMRGYPIIRGVAYVTHRGMVVPCSVAALYRGDSVDYQFLGGYDDDIRADLEWALTPIEAAALDALVAAVVDAVKADTEVVK